MTTSKEPDQNGTDDDVFDISDLPQLCGLKSDDILEYHRLHIVSLRTSGGNLHAGAHTLRRLRHISLLRDEHGMGSDSIGFVLGLMDRLEAAERELRTLRERL